MAWFPGADTSVKGNTSGAYKGGPWKIVHHTTEGSSAEGAFSAYRNNDTWPHFTVDSETIYQHVDTDTAASAVLNQSGGVETNRLSAIQIEVVTFAGEPTKPQATLRNVARLCRWLEAEHGIPAVWPSGAPRYGTSDPGGHNRSSSNWTSLSGHYAHSQVPENSHWDSSYWPDDLAIVMEPEMEAIRIVVNGTDQTEAIGAWLSQGNSVMDISDWCAYAGYAPPVWDNAARAVHVSTEKVNDARG